MAYRRKFPEQRACARPLVEHGVLRRRAAGVVVMGTGIIAIGFVVGDAFAVTVGVISVAAGGTISNGP
jgi:hypothetical protein